MQCESKNCQVAWKWQSCRGNHDKLTIILEAMASQDLWILDAFFALQVQTMTLTC